MRLMICLLATLLIASTSIYPKASPVKQYGIAYVSADTENATHFVVTSANLREIETWRRQKEYLESIVERPETFTLSVGYGTQAGVYGQVNYPIRW
jgi:hypothetical protein